MLLISCRQEDPPPPTIEEIYNIPSGVKESLIYEFMIHEIEGIVLNILYDLHERDGGVAATHEDYNVFSGRGNCAEQTLDDQANMLTLHFSNTCESDVNGWKRTGTITISYTDPKDGPGNIVIVNIDEFKLGGLGINGTLQMENISTSSSTESRNYILRMTNLELSVNNEASFFSGHRNINYTKENGNDFESTRLDYTSINDLSFEIANGDQFSMSQTTAQGFDCWLENIFFPNGGSIELQNDSGVITIDFGTQSCDYDVVILENDGEGKRFSLAEIL